MKKITKSVLYLQLTAMFVTAALAGPGATEKQVPFRGSVQALETYVIDFPTRYVDTSGSGNATHLGWFAVTWEHSVNLPTREGIGSAQFIAANGDAVFSVSASQGFPTETPNIVRVVERHTITGGTGRFAGASGSFTLERLVSPVTGLTSGWFYGTISY